MELCIFIFIKDNKNYFKFKFKDLNYFIEHELLMRFLEKFDPDDWTYIKQNSSYHIFKNKETYEISFYKNELWCSFGDFISWMPRTFIQKCYENLNNILINYNDKEYSLLEYKSEVLWKLY